MKHFGLGLVFGASAGFVLSLFSDKDGNRLGKNLKKNIEDTVLDATNLQTGLHKALDASNRLNENMPQASRAISDISDDFNKFKEHSQYLRDDMKYQAKKIMNNPVSKALITDTEEYLEKEYEAGEKEKENKD